MAVALSSQGDQLAPGIRMSRGEDTASAHGKGGVLTGKRVLVAEDAWHVARALRSVLEDNDLIVIGPASSIQEAWELADNSRPDLAIVDFNLKGEFSQKLIDHLQKRGIPVIVVTGYAHVTGAASKAAAILQKPFSGRTLLAMVREIVSGKPAT